MASVQEIRENSGKFKKALNSHEKLTEFEKKEEKSLSKRKEFYHSSIQLDDISFPQNTTYEQAMENSLMSEKGQGK